MTAHGQNVRADAKRDTRGLGGLEDLPVVKVPDAEAWSCQRRSPPQPTANPSTPSTAPPPTSPPVLNDAESRYLVAVRGHPGEASSRYPGLAKVSPRKALTIRARLIEMGFLRTHRVNRAGRGRDAIVLEVTESGFAALQRAGVLTP